MGVCVCSLISLVISSAGLNRILTVSEPVLNAIYPVAIVLIVLAFLGPLTRQMACHVSVQSILLTGALSVWCMPWNRVRLPYLS
ncbi:MAG: branched-chain amino acid transport system II carrier protein [Enterocloster bolteae]